MAKEKKVKVTEEGKNKPRGYEDTFDLSPNELEDLSSQIRADLVQAEDDKQIWLQDRIIDNKAYFGIKKQADWPFKGAAKISSMMHQIMVDTTGANLVASANAPENVLAVKTNKSQSIENAKYVSDVHNNLARYGYKIHEVIDRSWHNALIESFTVLKPVYQYEVQETVQSVKRWIANGYKPTDIKYDSSTDTVLGPDGQVVPSLDIERVPEDPEELKKMDLQECTIEVTKEIVEEGIKVYSISGSDIFIPIYAPGETPYEKYQRSPYVIHQEYKTIQEMEMLQEQGKIKNYETLRYCMAENITSEELRLTKEQQTGYFDLEKGKRDLIRNLWWYGKSKYKGKFRELVVLMNYETGVILKVQANIFGIRPLFPQVPFPVDGTPFGQSLPKKLRSLITELELVINTLINMGLIKAYPPKFFDPVGGLDPKTVGNFGPNAYIPVRDPQRNVFMPPQPEDPRVLFEMAKFLMDLIERAAANSDAVQGQISPTANTTAFEVQQSLVRAGVRFDVIYRRLKAQLEPMFDYIQMLTLRFMPVEKEVEIMGELAIVKAEDGSEQSRLQVIHQQEGKHGLVLAGNSITEEQVELQKATELLKLAATPPYSAYLSFKPETPYYLLFNAIKHYNPYMMDKILAKPEEVAKLLRDRQQVQSEQEQKAIEEGKNQGPSAEAQMMQMEMQIKAQQAQMDAQMKQHQMEMDLQKQQADMHMKEEEHNQKLRQMEEAHKLKMELMKEDQIAKAKAAANQPNKKS